MRSNTVASEVLRFIIENPGKTDGEINTLLYSEEKNHAHINITCRSLADQGYAVRQPRGDGRLGNYPKGTSPPVTLPGPGSASRDDIVIRIDRFLQDSKKPNHRYLSWDYCYAFFGRRDEIRASPDLQDHASLHLAWFLASWGMLRGSADLLWKNHTFLLPVVKAVVSPDFDELLGFDPSKSCKDLLLEKLFGASGLSQSIRRGFLALDQGFSASDILVTKVILGTTGASMAFDQYVMAGLKRAGLTAKFGRKAMACAFDFFEQHRGQFDQVEARGYPPFKLLDMYFFDLGKQASGAIEKEL
jgi:hypothetical protein